METFCYLGVAYRDMFMRLRKTATRPGSKIQAKRQARNGRSSNTQQPPNTVVTAHVVIKGPRSSALTMIGI